MTEYMRRKNSPMHKAAVAEEKALAASNKAHDSRSPEDHMAAAKAHRAAALTSQDHFGPSNHRASAAFHVGEAHRIQYENEVGSRYNVHPSKATMEQRATVIKELSAKGNTHAQNLSKLIKHTDYKAAVGGDKEAAKRVLSTPDNLHTQRTAAIAADRAGTTTKTIKYGPPGSDHASRAQEAVGVQKANTATRTADAQTARATANGTRQSHLVAASLHTEAQAAHTTINSPTADRHRAAANFHAARAETIGKPPVTPQLKTAAGVGGVSHTVTAEHYQAANAARTTANAASKKAFAAESQRNPKVPASELHAKAAEAHTNASKAFTATANSHAADTHRIEANAHQKQSGIMKARETVAKLKASPEYVPKSGESKPKASNGVKEQAAFYRKNPELHAQALQADKNHQTVLKNAGVRGRMGSSQSEMMKRRIGLKELKASPEYVPKPGEKVPGHTGGINPHADTAAVQAHATSASAKANAKPYLVSHSLAAKAHLAAAEHGVHTNYHTAQANYHKEQASIHSRRALAARKIGPGQKHGFHGQFVGPGGKK